MASNKSLIQVQELSCRFGKEQVLNKLTFDLFDGDILGIIGPSGGGKSVLLKLLADVSIGEDAEITGSIKRSFLSDSVDNGTSKNQPNESFLSGISLMFQEGALFDSLSVLDNVVFPLVDGRVPCGTVNVKRRREVVQAAQSVLSHVGLAEHYHKIPAQLSGGMRRRLSLARALITQPEVALLDDPTSGLDPVASSVIMKLISDLHQSLKTSMVLVSHDLRRLLPVCSRVIALFDGKIVHDGSLKDLSEAPTYVKDFVACRFDLASLEEGHVQV